MMTGQVRSLSVNQSAIGAQMGTVYRFGIVCPRRRRKQILHTHMLGDESRAPEGFVQ